MRHAWKETLSSVIAIVGIVAVFGRLESYKWWLIGSWKGALGVIAVLGLVLLLINVVEMVHFDDLPSVIETLLWIIAATVVIASLFTNTTRAEFIISSILVGVAGLAHMIDHFVTTNHKHKTHYSPAN
jgi:uncharacterized membrane protein